MLRLQGAELIEVPAVGYADPNNYVNTRAAARGSPRSIRPVRSGPINSTMWPTGKAIWRTGPEIWEQTEGRVDGFTCAVGTGGTLAGVALALKAKNPGIKIALADPLGAALYSYYKNGELKSSGSSITEGIGQGRITANLVDAPVDLAYQIPDEEALPIVFDLAG